MLRLVLGVALATGTVISPLTVIGEAACGDLCTGDVRLAASALLVQSDWSAPVDGVRGRLVVTRSDSAGTRQFKLELELQNVSAEGSPIEIWWTPLHSILDLSVIDETGKPLPPMMPPGHGLQPGPFWLPLMHQSSVRVVLASRAYQYVADDKVWLRLTIGQAWLFSRSSGPSRLFVGGTVRPQQKPETRARTWRGPLMLPRVEIPVATIR